MKIGTYYYPEQWPRDQWERDFDHIQTMGLQIVHMGEFAWFTMEPAEGDIRLDWLSEAVEMAAKRKLDVILCTPTAVPPIWLEQKYPEVLLVDQHGTPIRHGTRRHCSPTSPAYQDAARRIVTALADRFGNHPSVIGWQLDNEYSTPIFGQNDHTHAAFRAWLKQKYESIDRLNAAWGAQFWNTHYTSFDQILFPTSRDPKYGNPHQHLDASRFWSHAHAQFNKLQSDILRPRISGNSQLATGNSPFITTNFMPFHLDCNPADMAPDLSLITWDAYPAHGHVRDAQNEHFRIADPSYMGLIHDQMASYHGRWALMELQPGQVNWSGYPVLLYPGAVRLWIWSAYAHGAEFVTTYRFRQPRFGIELWHHGLVGPDGVTPTPGGREFAQTIDEMARLQSAPPAPRAAASVAEAPKPRRKSRLSLAVSPEPVAPTPAPPPLPAPTVGLMYSFEDLWWFATLPQAKRWDQPRWLKMWYAALARLGLDIRVLQPDRPIPAECQLVVAPSIQMVDDALISRFHDYAAAGGHLILTCRTGIMDRTGQLFEGPTAKPILPLIGGTIDAYDSLPEETFGAVELDGVKHPWGVWGDLLFAESARPIAHYADQFYAGAVAAMQNKVDKGLVTYCGVYAEQPFVDALVERIATQMKWPVTPLPDRVHLLRRGRHRILLNYQDRAIDAPAPKSAHFIIGSRKVPPAGVAIWED